MRKIAVYALALLVYPVAFFSVVVLRGENRWMFNDAFWQDVRESAEAPDAD